MDNLLIEKGYTKFNPSKIDSKNVEVKFQKRFDDDIGKKYFITVDKFNWTEFHLDHMPQYSYQFETQLYQKYTHNPINLTFFDGWDIEHVEQYLEKLWNNEEYDYYELFYL